MPAGADLLPATSRSEMWLWAAVGAAATGAVFMGVTAAASPDSFVATQASSRMLAFFGMLCGGSTGLFQSGHAQISKILADKEPKKYPLADYLGAELAWNQGRVVFGALTLLSLAGYASGS